MSGPFFNDLWRLMQNQEFQYFKSNYMKNWSDVETLFLYITMYEYIDKEFYHRFHKKIDKEQMSHILCTIFTKPKIRRRALEMFRSYQSAESDSNQNLLPRLPSYLFCEEHKKLT